MQHIHNVTERPDGKLPTTRVTNEIVRALPKPVILGGQTFPPRVTGAVEEESAPQYQGMVHIGVVANQAGWAFVPATTTV